MLDALRFDGCHHACKEKEEVRHERAEARGHRVYASRRQGGPPYGRRLRLGVLRGPTRLSGARGDAESFGWREGESFPIDESYCKRVLDGRIPQVVPDAKGEDATKDLRVTTEADIGSYCAVPLVLSDGRLYGTLCCLSHEPDPWLRERDLGLMERTARWLVEQLERHGSL